MVKQDTRQVYNVVFVVEATANVGAYFDSLKSFYIQPSLEFFNNGPPQEVDYGCPSSCSLYTLVTFHGSDVAPASLTTCYDPTTSIHQFSQLLDSISFASGRGDFASHMSEGLSTAAQAFDDLAKMREPNLTVQKHCILICNSTPYNVVSQDSRNYAGLTTEQLISRFAEHNVHFSIMSPRKIPDLYRLFELGSGDMTSLSKNYTLDSRHLVLLKGFQLQERPLSPSAKKEDQTFNGTSAVVPKSDNTGVPGPILPQARIVNPVVASVSVPRPQNVTAPMPMNPVAKDARGRMIPPMIINPQQPQQQQPPQQQQQQSIGMMPGFPSQMRRGVAPPQMTGPTMSTSMMGAQPPGMAGGFGSNMMGIQQTNPGGMMIAPQQMMDVMPNVQDPVSIPVPGSGLIGVDLNNPGQALQAAAIAQQQQQQQQRTIWSGLLEFTDKPKPSDNATRTTRTIPCQVTANADDPEINTSKWPEKMSMSIMPQVLITPLQSLLKNNRTVTFNFGTQDQEVIAALYRSMNITNNASACCGCINLSVAQDSSPMDVRVIVVMFIARKRQFIGVIPSDQAKFITGIRAVINRHKTSQTNKQMATNAFGSVVAPPIMSVSSAQQMMSGGQVQQGQQPNASLEEQRTSVMQFQHNQAMAAAADQQRQQQQQQLFVQQQQQQLLHQRVQQQQQQQQQQQHLQSMTTNQPLKHLLLNPQQQQLRQQQQVQMMLQHRQRGAVPQAAPNVQPGLQPPGMVPQMQPSQNFGQMPDDMGFNLN